jgi:hypothetical protein
MPQATTLRLVRGSSDTRKVVSGSALSLVQHHASQMRRVHTLAASMAADADVLCEALRYFVIAPQRRSAAR